MWTRFADMHSGGGRKEEPYEYIYIEAPEEEAKVIFYNRFAHSPERITCTCCGCDYSIFEAETLEAASAYDRQCEHMEGRKYNLSTAKVSVEDYAARRNILIISATEIKPVERSNPRAAAREA